MKADLHMHSTASDGSMSPIELMETARRKDLDVVALTDHDSVGGIEQASETAHRLGMKFIPGIEFNTVLGDEDIHLLAYWVNPEAESLRRFLRERRDERVRRVERIVELLRERCGIELDLEEVRKDSDEQALTRLHVARALVRRGYGKGSDEVFSRFMAKGGPAYVRQESMSPMDAVALTKELGGIAVLAHPVEIDRPFDLIPELTAEGLGGIEVYYPEQGPDLREKLLAYAEEHGLIVTGGSDFHGEGSRHTCDLGGVAIPREAVARLLSWSPLEKRSGGAGR